MEENTAIGYVQTIIDNASLDKARKKVPDLRLGTYAILHRRTPEACIQGVAGLAACASPDELRGRAYLGSTVLKRLGWTGALKQLRTRCPRCEPHPPKSIKAQAAVAHVNDQHPLKGPATSSEKLEHTIATLRLWIHQEEAA